GLVGALQQGVAAGEVVVGQRVVGAELHQALVDLHPLGVAALEREVVPLDAQDVHVFGVALEDAAEELELEVQLVLVRPPDGCAAGARDVGSLVRVLALVCHGSPCDEAEGPGRCGRPSSTRMSADAGPVKPARKPRRPPPGSGDSAAATLATQYTGPPRK